MQARREKKAYPPGMAEERIRNPRFKRANLIVETAVPKTFGKNLGAGDEKKKFP